SGGKVGNYDIYLQSGENAIGNVGTFHKKECRLNVTSISPTNGPDIGGTEIYVQGNFFSENTLCRFSSSDSGAATTIWGISAVTNFINSSFIICTSPQGLGNSFLDVSIDGGLCWSNQLH